ncbi:MAG: hypothetical protein JWR77_1915 [Rhizorhabdus sp.]|nr:hypothetical protein [Rhizorhabdus sp.]
MSIKGVSGQLIGAAMAASLLILAPVASFAAKSPEAKAISEAKAKAAKKRLGSIGSFTPAASDPRRAALFNRAGVNFGDASFRFTPSGGGGRRAVTVAIRARATTKAGAERTAAIMINSAAINAGLDASAYSLGASVGWKHFALAGDVARIDGGITAENRDMADIGLSYSGSKWSTRLLLGAERATGLRPRIGGPEEVMSVDLGGSYALTGNLELNGGVRYKSQRERAELSNDQRRDSQAIYVGTAFRF